MIPRSPTNCALGARRRNVILATNRRAGRPLRRLVAHSSNYLNGQFGISIRLAAFVVTKRVLTVFKVCKVLQIISTAIRPNTINVINLFAFRSWPDKRQRNKNMNLDVSTHTVLPKLNIPIAVFRLLLPEHVMAFASSATKESLNAPEVADFVKIKSRIGDNAPLFRFKFFGGKLRLGHELNLLNSVFSLWSGSRDANTSFGPSLIVA